MRLMKGAMGATIIALAALVLVSFTDAQAAPFNEQMNPVAIQKLKKLTDYMNHLQAFSVRTQSTMEDLLVSGHKVDIDVSADVIIKRPNMLRAERKGSRRTDQVFTYNGKTLTLYNPADKVYAVEALPGTIETALGFAQQTLGITIPASDLIYQNNFKLLMQGVTMAADLGKTTINGVSCDHLLFSRPGVDFQVWIADKGDPLPYKYVVTDTTTPALMSFTTYMSGWDTKQDLKKVRFGFSAPKGVKKIDFMPVNTTGGAGR